MKHLKRMAYSYKAQNYGGLSLVNDLEKAVFAKYRYLA